MPTIKPGFRSRVADEIKKRPANLSRRDLLGRTANKIDHVVVAVTL